MNHNDEFVLEITNNTASDVVIENIALKECNHDVSVEYNFSLPYTLAVGESAEVILYIEWCMKELLFETELVITSSVGEQIIPVKYDGWIGLEEKNVISAEIYPNPMNDILYIESDDVVSVTVFNAVGQQVLFVENRNEIDVAELNNGLYFVRLVDNKGNTLTKKIIKQ